MNDIKKLSSQLKTVKARANMDLEACDHRVRPGMEMAKREAQDQLVQLENEYIKMARANSLGIFLSGDHERQAAFAKLGVKVTSTQSFVVDADGLYKRLAARVEPSLGNTKVFSVSQLSLTLQALRDIEKELDILRMPLPTLKRDVAINSHAEMVNYMRILFRDSIGDDLTRIYLDRQINRAAVDGGFVDDRLVVFVTGAEQQEVVGCAPIFTNSVSVSVGTPEDGEVDEKFVLEKLSSIKKHLKKKHSTE